MSSSTRARSTGGFSTEALCVQLLPHRTDPRLLRALLLQSFRQFLFEIDDIVAGGRGLRDVLLPALAVLLVIAKGLVKAGLLGGKQVLDAHVRVLDGRQSLALLVRADLAQGKQRENGTRNGVS